MVKTESKHVWAKRLTLIGSFGSWLLLLLVILDYLKSGELLISNYQGLVMLSFSLAIIGFISGIEIHADIPFKEIMGHKGSTRLMTACMFSSALLVLGLCICLLTPYFWVVL